MQVPCPSCAQPIEQNSPPGRVPSNDGSEGWLCLKCPAVVCVHCYHDHTGTVHPEAYKSRPTEGSKKNQRRKK